MSEQENASGATVPCILLADPPFLARYKRRSPDPGVCRIITIDWEKRRLSMSNGCCRYYPDFDEVDIVTDNKVSKDLEHDRRSWSQSSKGDWVFERSSGHVGFRCKRCATWVREDEERWCNCDQVEEV